MQYIQRKFINGLPIDQKDIIRKKKKIKVKYKQSKM